MTAFDTPLLLLVYNRPDHTRKLLEVLKSIKPNQLYVVADGPREADQSKCEEVRELFSDLKWKCQLKTLFHDENLGCARSVSGGITWFFEHVESGIILEDDCIPSQSFFQYCEELLEHYRDDKRIMHIGSNNFQNGKIRGNGDYYFSIFNHIWGWATWKRAWEMYQLEIENIDKKSIHSFVNDHEIEKYFYALFETVIAQKIDTWDFSWTYACWKNQGLSISPNKNLVTNIGFGEEATHTKSKNSPQSNVKMHELNFPLEHPIKVQRNLRADKYAFKRIFKSKQGVLNRLKEKVKRKLSRT